MTVSDDADVKIGLTTIWAIGVGSALGGDYFGWQFCLYGGFGSAFISVLYCGIFYWLYAGAITELAARYRSSGGSFDFVERALGKRYAALMGVLGLLKLVLANCAVALAVSSYMVSGGMPTFLQAFCWIGMYSVFTFLDCSGIHQSANVQIGGTILCVSILILYSVSCFTKFSVSNILSTNLYEDGMMGFLKGLPFALQFYDGFEEVPLLIGYTKNPERTIPRAIFLCYVTVAIIAFMILISGSGASPISTILNSEAPLMVGIDAVYGDGTIISDTIAYVIVIGLIVNFFSFTVFTSQQVCAIAEAGQLPSFLKYRHPKHNAPIAASITSACVGIFITACFALLFGEDGAQNTLVTATLMPAVLGYMLLLECIVEVRKSIDSNKIKITYQDEIKIGFEPGPLTFTYGTLGARLAQLMCFICVLSLIVLAQSSTDFMYGLIVLFIIGMIIFVIMNFYVDAIEESEKYVHVGDISDDEGRLIHELQGASTTSHKLSYLNNTNDLGFETPNTKVYQK